MLGFTFSKHVQTTYEMSHLQYRRLQNFSFYSRVITNPNDVGLHIWAYPAFAVTSSEEGVVHTPRMKDLFHCSFLERTTERKFIDDIERALSALPPYLKTLFAEYPLNVRVGRRMADVAPDTYHDKARGHTCTLEYLSAHFNAQTRTVYMSQEVKTDGSDEYHLDTDCPYDIALHEIGHALDDILDVTDTGNRKSRFAPIYQKDFMNAYRRDINQLRAGKGPAQDLEYYRTREDSGAHENENAARSEVFAELFSEHMGDRDNLPIHRAFPDSTKCFRKILAGLHHYMSTTSFCNQVVVPSNHVRYVTETRHLFFRT